jgi:hypothetical protein
MIFLLVGVRAYSQREIVFDYDTSGNQIFRGEHNSPNSSSQNSINSIIIIPDISAEEKEFWSKMSIGPNPTSDFLFISMQDSAKNKISKIELYQQSSLGARVYHQDIHQSSLSRSWDWKPYFQYRTHNPFTSW